MSETLTLSDKRMEVLKRAQRQVGPACSAEVRTYLLTLQAGGHRLPPDIKDKWTGALRSGHFTQGKQRLLDNGRYCCLGVLAELDSTVVRTDDVFRFPTPSGPEVDTTLPPAGYCQARLGVQRATMNTLARLNDTGVDFDTIADIIDLYL